jgi:hypothetical protein
MEAPTLIPLPPLPGFRAVPMHGAMLYFDRATGTHIRIASPATAMCRRQAPRVVMFGITNACNLDCDFCSRDRGRDSRWTVESAFDALHDLAEAGTLEVAFGGGEPFVFPGFAHLLAKLREETPLALHVTTNGSLISTERWQKYVGLLDMVRLSIYDEPTWRTAAGTLTASRQKWGANILVDDNRIERLPELLAELAAAGCSDVSILTYVGSAPARQLTMCGRQRLAAVLADSPLPARLSVCAGSAISVPRLRHAPELGADCGAGTDFVSITPDQGMLACSFQDGQTLPARTAQEILEHWRARDGRMASASKRIGCARQVPVNEADAAQHRVSIWRSYSGNNSGECVMVASFGTIIDAEAYLAELMPGWKHNSVSEEELLSGSEHDSVSEEWKKLFAREQVVAPSAADQFAEAYNSPRTLIAFGKSVIATGYAADDSLAALRSLAWKRGAFVLPGGVHVHDPLTFLAAVRCRDITDACAIDEKVSSLAMPIRTWRHGDRLLMAVLIGEPAPSHQPVSLDDLKTALTPIVADRPLAADIVLEPFDDERMTAVKQRLGVELPRRRRLLASFYPRPEMAISFARSLGDQPAIVAASEVLIDPVERPKRLSVLSYRRGAQVTVLDGLEVTVTGYLWYSVPRRKGAKARIPPIDVDVIRERLKGYRANRNVDVSLSSETQCSVSLTTAEPGHALSMLVDIATAIGWQVASNVQEVDSLAWSVRRVLEGVAEYRRATE